jgi:hypothetical protein
MGIKALEQIVVGKDKSAYKKLLPKGKVIKGWL